MSSTVKDGAIFHNACVHSGREKISGCTIAAGGRWQRVGSAREGGI